MSKFYDGGTMLSYRKHINIIMGHRSTGKTFWAKKRAILKFLKTGKGSVWLRRYKTELKSDKLNKFFIDIISINEKMTKPWFPITTKLEVKGYTAYCNGKPFLQFIPLSVSNTYKSVPFDECEDIYFDEFIIDKSNIRYLPNEVETLFDYFFTFMRERFGDVYMFMLANAISSVNPYFLYFKIKMTNKEFTFDKSNELLVQNYKSQEIIEEYKNSWIGRLLKGTDYFAYAVENEFLRDNDKFIEQRSKNAIFRCCIFFKGNYYGFWVDFKTGIMYASVKYDPNSMNIYTLTREDQSVNMLLIKNKQNTYISELLFEFQCGALRFENQAVKSAVMEMLSFFIR